MADLVDEIVGKYIHIEETDPDDLTGDTGQGVVDSAVVVEGVLFITLRDNEIGSNRRFVGAADGRYLNITFL